jgi:hypothetical protein
MFRYICIILSEFHSCTSSCDVGQRHKTTCHVVREPPQFSTHHLSTHATSTQGKSVILYNSTSIFIFHQPMNFYFILNLIVFIEKYPDCLYGHVKTQLIQIIL